jgi:hypothetical protein
VLTRSFIIQIKYFKDKRVMEYDRDQTIKNIKEDDAKLQEKINAEKKLKGWFG